ncbi:NAD(P)/FAD-dependent oxidoreductase [Hoeflea poritis]|uniref:FAD-binding oxidoreductase n=1 Tax=Hoeflea poritis TaxID=2993659 RepID=A0ABT4VRS4_9HYPH|nr:FAD-binding oxidoreductase [Hoeflea poritis]MDA4847401.1 FAD-binding oxidoreductase [Hoeflea poritis]
MTDSGPKTIVIGGGIVGASIAYHLARRGAAVTLIDGNDPQQGATARSFAWINAWSGRTMPYMRLRHHAIGEYHRLQQELNGALPLKWNGTLIWKAGPAETEKRARRLAKAGYDVRLVDGGEIARMEPNLKNPPAVAAYAANEGAAEPVETTRILLRAARQAGAEILAPQTVEALVATNGRISAVRVAGALLEADVVVAAAGTGTNTLTRELGLSVPVEASPAIIARFRTDTPLARSVIIHPSMEIRQVSEHELLAAAAYIDDSGQNGPNAVANRILAAIENDFLRARDVRFDNVEVGWRPIPSDGLPIVGFAGQIEGLYLAVMHSGITLAPAIGRFAAVEILDRIEVGLLDICRPGRFDD